ncbi:hypothetical protein D9M71_752710 [compost metagenome]
MLRKGQFQGGEPVVAQALDLGPLGREIVALALFGAPLIQVVHLLRGRVARQFRVGDVVQDHGQGEGHQGHNQSQ